MGWIAIDRKIQRNSIWKIKPFSKGQAWIDLLLTANHKTEPFYSESNRCVIDGERGNVYRSISYFADTWGWSRPKVDNFLAELERLGMIKVCKKKASKKTYITIVNYELYQDVNASKNSKKMQEKCKTPYKTNAREMQDECIYNNINNIEQDKQEEQYSSTEPEDEDDGFFESWIIIDGKKEFIDMKQVDTEEGFIYFDRAGRKYITDWDKGYRLADE